MFQEIQALLRATDELLKFVDFEQAIMHEDLARRELERKYPHLVVKPAIQLPSKGYANDKI